ncbi:hypothetical protein ACK87S_08660, partial [Burkholderia pseudomallei]
RRHAATPPRRHAATPPRRHAATSPHRHIATSPHRHIATSSRALTVDEAMRSSSEKAVGAFAIRVVIS